MKIYFILHHQLNEENERVKQISFLLNNENFWISRRSRYSETDVKQTLNKVPMKEIFVNLFCII